MGAIETRLWGNTRRRGAAYTGVGLALGTAAGRSLRSTAMAVGVSVAGRELRSVSARIADHLVRDDLASARTDLPSLVGRDPSGLDASAISAAVIESLAENSVDAVFAPAFWGSIGGAAGALGYRAVNTMDAMVGHRSERYERFGWASARLDDAANLLPARLFALTIMAVEPRRSHDIRQTVRRDAPHHPSPNSGVAEAAVAAALGIELGGTLRYGDRIEHRPRLGTGPRPQPLDIARTIRLTDRAERLLVAALLGVGASVIGRRAGGRQG